MRRALHRLALVEIAVAMHLGALARWWAACAAERLERFSGNPAGRS